MSRVLRLTSVFGVEVANSAPSEKHWRFICNTEEDTLNHNNWYNFLYGAEVLEDRNSGISRYEVECHSSLTYDSVVLLVPDSEPIILADLNFACYRPKGYCSSFIAFDTEAVLSMKSPFGKVIGIALQYRNKSALHPNRSSLSYTMSFEKVSLPSIILQKLLKTRP